MKSMMIRSLLVVCGTIALAASGASAQQIFVKLDGLQGDAKAKGFEGAIAAKGLQLGVTNAVAVTNTRTGTSTGKAQFSDIVIVKDVDSASPHLIVSCASGKRLKSATISLVTSGRDGAGFEFLTYRLSDVAITSVAASASENSMPTEQLTLSFARIEIEYRPMDASGKPGTPIRTGWDVSQNKTASARFSSDAVASADGTGAAFVGAGPVVMLTRLPIVACCSAVAIRPRR